MSSTPDLSTDPSSPPALMRSRRFAPLFWTQFFAAFNDNFLKNTLVILILAAVAQKGQGQLITLAGAIFMLPFLLFSATGGELADRFDKAWLAKRLKAAEVVVAVFAAVALAYASITLLMVALFLFGVGSALFGPIKYSVIPEQMPQSSLPKANAWIEAATFVAILGGTIGAAVVSVASETNPDAHPGTLSAVLMVVFAVIAWVSSTFMPWHGPAKADLPIGRNFLRTTARLLGEVKRERKLFTVALMVSWFWFLGAVLLSIVPLLTNALGNYRQGMAFFLTLFAVAVALGSAIAAWLSAGRIVLLQSVIGTLIFGLISLDLAFAIRALPVVADVYSFGEFLALSGIIHISTDIMLMAIAGSFLVVPGFAALQAWAAPERRARVIASNNVLNAGVMVAGGVILALLQAAGLPLFAVPLLLGVLSIAAACVMLKFLPTDPFRDFISILFRAFFRLEVKGAAHLKNAGETPILALNHVSFLDGLLALAISENGQLRSPVFAMNTEIAQRWWIRPFIKYMNVYRLDPTHPMAVRGLITAVREGSPLVIFPEGRITVTGSLMKVYDGAAMVADRTAVKIVPIKIDGLERTPFSRLNGVQVRRRLFPKVTATITAPVTLNLSPDLKSHERRLAAGNELYRIMSDLVFNTAVKKGTIFTEVVNAARLYGMRHAAIEDPFGGGMPYGRMLTGTRALAQRLAVHLKSEKNVGLMLPNANAAPIAFLALLSAGKTPAMMNYSAGFATLHAAVTAAQVRSIVSSQAFVDKAGLQDTVRLLADAGVRFVWLETLREEISLPRKLLALVNRTRPVSNAPRHADPAVILFTSGSEGAPKGVVLTHANILSNVAQAAARVDFNKADKMFNVLPVFHSFGLTAGTILPMVSGVPVYFYPSPLHYRIVPEAIYSSNATIIFGTDTFLNGYGRNAHPYDLRSIRYCFAGAEAVKPATRQMMMEKFGIRILEGYGVTETAPVAALNTPMYNKTGTVGKLVPGMQARLEKVDGIDAGGRLFLRGPNVMAGYLRVDAPGVIEPPPEGWHDTGDIANIDDEGFIAIVGRAKRFAKIGGEMVSLTAVEALASRCFALVPLGVVAVPDARKGEALVLVSEDASVTRTALLKLAREEGVAELFVPSRILHAPLPLLGTGKINYPALREWVVQATADSDRSNNADVQDDEDEV